MLHPCCCSNDSASSPSTPLQRTRSMSGVASASSSSLDVPVSQNAAAKDARELRKLGKCGSDAGSPALPNAAGQFPASIPGSYAAHRGSSEVAEPRQCTHHNQALRSRSLPAADARASCDEHASAAIDVPCSSGAADLHMRRTPSDYSECSCPAPLSSSSSLSSVYHSPQEESPIGSSLQAAARGAHQVFRRQVGRAARLLSTAGDLVQAQLHWGFTPRVRKRRPC